MKIAHVITRLIVGGAQENTVLTCRGLADKGHDVTLLAGPETGPEGSLWDQTFGAGYSTIRVDSLRRAIHPVHDVRAYRELRRIFGEIAPQVVHTHSSKAGIIARMAAAAAGVPIIVHTVHGMSFNRTQGRIVRAGYRWLERRVARQTTAFVCVAQSMVEQCVSAGIAERERFVVIRSGMETDRFFPRAEVRAAIRRRWGVGGDEIVVGTVARLFVNKGYEEMIEAMLDAIARCPRLRFVWVGHGPHRERYEGRLDRLGLSDRVVFTGLL
ncbi:MAG: glycosyltransferase, partial [Planctomycetota bacterium]